MSQNNQHPMPEHIAAYFKKYVTKMPACCHTCNSYMSDGTCSVYKVTPPEDFAQTFDQCDQWQELIPF